jgi:hypothetical protein
MLCGHPASGALGCLRVAKKIGLKGSNLCWAIYTSGSKSLQ